MICHIILDGKYATWVDRILSTDIRIDSVRDTEQHDRSCLRTGTNKLKIYYYKNKCLRAIYPSYWASWCKILLNVNRVQSVWLDMWWTICMSLKLFFLIFHTNDFLEVFLSSRNTAKWKVLNVATPGDRLVQFRIYQKSIPLIFSCFILIHKYFYETDMIGKWINWILCWCDSCFLCDTEKVCFGVWKWIHIANRGTAVRYAMRDSPDYGGCI